MMWTSHLIIRVMNKRYLLIIQQYLGTQTCKNHLESNGILGTRNPTYIIKGSRRHCLWCLTSRICRLSIKIREWPDLRSSGFSQNRPGTREPSEVPSWEGRSGDGLKTTNGRQEPQGTENRRSEVRSKTEREVYQKRETSKGETFRGGKKEK